MERYIYLTEKVPTVLQIGVNREVVYKSDPLSTVACDINPLV